MNGIHAQSKSIVSEIEQKGQMSVQEIIPLFYRISQFFSARNEEQGQMLFPVIIYSGDDPSYLGILAPALREENSSELQKTIKSILHKGVFSAGGRIAKSEETPFLELQTITQKTAADLEQILAERLNDDELKKANIGFKFLHKAQPTWQKPAYTLEELSMLTDVPKQEMLTLAMRFPVLKRKRIKIQGKTYYWHDTIDYLKNPEKEHESLRAELLEVGKAQPYMTLQRWDHLREMSKTKILSSREIINLFGNWDSFMDACGHKEQQSRAKGLTREQVLEFGKKYISQYGTGPAENIWEKDHFFPEPGEVKKYWKSFAEFRKELGCEEDPVVAKNKKITPSQGIKIKKLAVSGKKDISIARDLSIPVQKVRALLAKLGAIDPKKIQQELDTIEKIEHYAHAGAINYEKQAIRDAMLEKMIESLSNPNEIRYLGLEGPNFSSYISLARLTKIIPQESLVAEWDAKSFLTMQSIVQNCRLIRGGEIFAGLELHFGKLSDAVQEKERKNQFNFVNLDYQGMINQEKLQSIHDLFALSRLEKEAVIFITLNNSSLAKARLVKGSTALGSFHSNGFPTSNQAVLTHHYISTFARNSGYKIEKIENKEYQCRDTPMIFLSYRAALQQNHLI